MKGNKTSNCEFTPNTFLYISDSYIPTKTRYDIEISETTNLPAGQAGFVY